MTMLKQLRTGLACALLSQMVGCASTPAMVVKTVQAPQAASTARHATIVSIRPVMLTTPKINNDMLSALGSGAATNDVQNFLRSQQMEFIVLEEGAAQPVSVVQGNAAQWRVGERVLLTRDGKTRLARD